MKCKGKGIVKNCEAEKTWARLAAAPCWVSGFWYSVFWFLLLLRLGRRLIRSLVRRQILPWRDVRHVGHAGDLAAGCVVNADAGVIERYPDRAVQLNARLFVSRHRRHKCGLSRREGAAVLQHQGRGRGAELILLLFGVERLLGVIDGSLR